MWRDFGADLGRDKLFCVYLHFYIKQAEQNEDQISNVSNGTVLGFWNHERKVLKANVRVNSNREHPPGQSPGQTPGIGKNRSNARPCGQLSLVNTPPPVSTMKVKCPALRSITPKYKNISCHFLLDFLKQVTK